MAASIAAGAIFLYSERKFPSGVSWLPALSQGAMPVNERAKASRCVDDSQWQPPRCSNGHGSVKTSF